MGARRRRLWPHEGDELLGLLQPDRGRVATELQPVELASRARAGRTTHRLSRRTDALCPDRQAARLGRGSREKLVRERGDGRRQTRGIRPGDRQIGRRGRALLLQPAPGATSDDPPQTPPWQGP
jgi:hypothetical protein